MKSVLFYTISLLCGASAFMTDSSSRITNGNAAAINNFPYSVSLQRASAQTLIDVHRGHRCGGAMITYQHVLTAASCLYDNINGVPTLITPSEYRIFGGFASLLEDGDQNRIRTIANFSVHPEYIAPPASLNDIAIITLITPFLNTTITPISLPVADFEPADFALCQIASWGSQNATSTASYNLRYVEKYIYSQTLCVTVYSHLQTLANIFPTMVCAASYNIVSSGCTGDVGAALVCSGGFTGILVQTQGCAVSSYPEVYTRVSNYTTWARSITGGSSTIRPEITLFTVLAIMLAKFVSTQ